MAKDKGTGGHEYSPRALKRALRDRDPEVRRRAVHVIGKTGGPDALPLLGIALEDPTTLVRAQVVVMLRTFTDSEALRMLAETLQNDPHPFVRGKAAWSLGETGEPSVVKLLAPALEEHDNYVSRCAAAAIKKIGGPDVAVEPAEVEPVVIEESIPATKPKVPANAKPKPAEKPRSRTKAKPTAKPKPKATAKPKTPARPKTAAKPKTSTQPGKANS